MPVRRIVGIDYGEVRIGLAVGDDEVRIASPHSQYQRQGAEQDAKFFRKLAEEEAVALFVVGLPLHLSGRDSKVSVAAEEFGRWLERTTGVSRPLLRRAVLVRLRRPSDAGSGTLLASVARDVAT